MPQTIGAQMSLFGGGSRPALDTVEARWPEPDRGCLGIEICVLASGSSGNATVVRVGGADGHAVLIDAGIGPRSITKRLIRTGVGVDRIRAIFLTHLDQDHFRPTWIPVLVRLKIPIYLDRAHLASLDRVDGPGLLRSAGLVRVLRRDGVDSVAGVHVRSLRLPHDTKGSTGYLIRTAGTDPQALGYATDLGRVPDRMIEFFAGVDLLAIESNYDPKMQGASARPVFLKKRITGGNGHLSNMQAFDASRRIAAASPTGYPDHVVLLHRSRQCNCPHVVRKVFANDPHLAGRVTLAEQFERTDWLGPHRRRPGQPLEA